MVHQHSFWLQRPLVNRHRRQIFIDTNTTGPSPTAGHRIMEIAAVLCEDGEVVEEFWEFINPQRSIGWADYYKDSLTDKEYRSEIRYWEGHYKDCLASAKLFTQIADDFVDFVRGSEVIVHYAPFDRPFLDAELVKSGRPPLAAIAAKTTCFISWVRSNKAYRRTRFRHSDFLSWVRINKVELVQNGRLPTEDIFSKMQRAQTNDDNRGREYLGALAQYYGIGPVEQQGYDNFVAIMEWGDNYVEEMQRGPVFMSALFGAALLGKLYHRLGGSQAPP